MRSRRARASEFDEGESYYISLTDMLVGVIFIFIIMLSYFVFQFQATTAAITASKQPQTAALLQMATNLKQRQAQVAVDEKARVVCLPNTALGEPNAGPETQRCFSYADSHAPPSQPGIPAAPDARALLVSGVVADMGDQSAGGGAPVASSGADGFAFATDQLFVPNTAQLSPNGQQTAANLARSLAHRLPCYGFGAQAPADCPANASKLWVVNVLCQTNLDAFSAQGQAAAALALQRAVAFHHALTSDQPPLATVYNGPPDQGASQPLLRVATQDQSDASAARLAGNQTLSIQFVMAPSAGG